MKKNIYGLLNEIEIDLGEYEETELSSVEKEAHKQRILQEVKNMKHNTKQNTVKSGAWKIAAGTAAACAIIVTAFGIANPTLAKNLFSSTFGNLIDNAKGEKYEEEQIDMYSKIGEKSVEAEAEVEKRADKEMYHTTAESNGVTISVSDLYCDGYVLYYTASLKTEDEGLSRADGIVTASKELGSDELKIEGMDLSGYGGRPFEKSADGTFVSADQISLMSDEDDLQMTEGENGTIVADWTITNLTGYLWDSWDESGEYEKTGTVEGEWHLRFPVTVDASLNETFAIEKEENGVVVKEAIKTKAGLVVHVHLPDFRKAPYNDPYNDPDIGIKDAQGNYMQWLAQKSSENADGTSESWIMVLYDGEKDLSFEVTTKDEEQRKIADVGFHVEQ